MPRLLFLVNHLTGGVYTCHTRLEFASAREQQTFLQRERPIHTHGWHLSLSSPARKGYDGKPVYQTDLRLSTPYPRAAARPETEPKAPQEERVCEDNSALGRNHSPPDGLTWQEQHLFQREITDLLRQMGVTDLGWRHQR